MSEPAPPRRAAPRRTARRRRRLHADANFLVANDVRDIELHDIIWITSRTFPV